MKEATSLSPILMDQMNQSSGTLILTEKAPVLPLIPPFLLLDITATTKETQYSFQSFESSDELFARFPDAQLKRGHPKEVYQFLSENSDVFLDFDQLGLVRLSRERKANEPTNLKVSRWLNYALSPELWGPDGKWTRFHDRLHNLFEKQNLLERHSVPGYYPLKSNAYRWEKLSLKGDQNNDGISLVLPWTFSLTDLRRLEKFVSEEK